jgi:two-component system, OmpR family, response regulator RegX3
MNFPATKTRRPRSLLIVEDDVMLQQTVRLLFEERGFDVMTAGTVREAQTRFWSRQRWHLILSDYHLPDGTGLDFCHWVRRQPGEAPAFLIMSGAMQPGEIVGVEFIAKPFGLAELEARTRALLEGEPEELRSASSE